MLARILSIASLLLASKLAAAEPPITAAAFTPDGKAVVVGSQKGLSVYDWPELAELRSLTTGLAHVHDLIFSPDGLTLAAVGGQPAEEGRIELINWPQAKIMHQQSVGEDLLYRVAWDERSKSLATAGPDHGITLLDGSAMIVRQVEGHSRDVMSIGFLPDGHFVSGSRDNTIRVWASPSNELVRTLNNHTNEIHDIAVRLNSPEPPFVIASSSA
ncbi:MAG TPA: hypothetical protein P5307_19650, partial [Pirellulaceae bacterium]|nr:hypothetical protein [Pirellulaceae bacterium]